MSTFISTRTEDNRAAHRVGHSPGSKESYSVFRPATCSAFPLQRKASCACGGGCPDCQNKPAIQTKLSISEPGDSYEQEADRVAGQIMRMPDAGLAREDTISTPVRAMSLQREIAPHDGVALNSGVAVAEAAGGGTPLRDDVRGYFEPRFGYDFSGVRIHTGMRAHEAARSINAVAYTLGQNVVFEAGRYAPDSVAGRHLLAHELTHVVQQNGGTTNGHLNVQRSIGPMLQRQQATCAIDFIQLAKLFAGDTGAALEVLNCCGEGLGPLPKGCTADMVKAAKKVFKKRNKGPQKADCSGLTGFRPATSREFIGQCCRGKEKRELSGETVITGFESKENCCPPERISAKDPIMPRCCSDNEEVKDGLCAQMNCPPGQTRTIFGTCVSSTPPVKPPNNPPVKPPVKPPAPFTTINNVIIEFKKDAPQSWYTFNASVTVDGKTHFDELIAALSVQPEANVQLKGHASSEKPKGDEDYNKRLTDRRVKMVADELKKKKIDAARVSDPPSQASPSDCEEIASGQLSCGDARASTPADVSDRKVDAQIFTVTK